MTNRRALPLQYTCLLALLLVGVACGAPAEPPAEEPAAEVAPEAAPAAMPRVFFSNLEEGGSYTSPLIIEFGIEDFSIEPVGDGAINEGAGHFHLAVDTECGLQGVVIPQGGGYIHFGDGSAQIEMQLDPGEHTLCLQIGDGEHRIPEGADLSGLTQSITITIE